MLRAHCAETPTYARREKKKYRQQQLEWAHGAQMEVARGDPSARILSGTARFVEKEGTRKKLSRH